MQSKFLSIERPVLPEQKTPDFHEEKGCLNKIYKYLGLFKKNVSQEFEEKKLSPYVINTNIVKEEKLIERELLIRANPLHGNKHTQKESDDTCSYYALNYIRTRYKQCPHLFQKERHIEKVFSKCKRKATNVSLCIDRFKKLFDFWIKENKINSLSSMTTQEWITFLSLKAEDHVIISNPSHSKEKNGYLLTETYKYISSFIELMKHEGSFTTTPSTFTVEQMKNCIKLYRKYLLKIIEKEILEQDLKLNFSALVKTFFSERGVDPTVHNIPELVSEISDSTLTEKIFLDQEARLNKLNFLGRNITNSLSSLLDVIETNGPLVVVMNGNIADQTKTTFIKSVSNYPISDLTFSEQEHESRHAMVLVGGGVDKMSKEFVYLIDPNDKFTAQSKAPVYRIPFDKFKENLVPYDIDFTFEKNNKSYSLDKNYFVYSKNGLNLTRDPIQKKEIATDSMPISHFR